MLQKLYGPGWDGLVFLFNAPETALGQLGVGGLSLRERDLGEVEGAELQVNVAAFGYKGRGIQGGGESFQCQCRQGLKSGL